MCIVSTLYSFRNWEIIGDRAASKSSIACCPGLRRDVRVAQAVEGSRARWVTPSRHWRQGTATVHCRRFESALGDAVEALADGARQLRREIGFGEKEGFPLAEIAAQGFRTVAAAVNDFEPWATFLELDSQLGSAHSFGHHHIGKQQVDFAIELVPDAQSFGPGTGLEHSVGLAFEKVADELAQHLLVFDHQDGFFAAADGLQNHGSLGGGLGGALGGGEIDLECGADADLAGDFGPALVLFDDAINGGQPQAGALADLFGGKERLEKPVQRLPVHAAAAVRNPQTNQKAASRVGLLRHVGVIDFDGGGADEELATVGHGVAGVHGQVHDDLLEHADVGLDMQQVGGIVGVQGDVFAQQPLEHLGKVLEDGVNLEDLGLDDLLAAEHEQLAGERCGALRGQGNLLEWAGRGGVGVRAGEEQFRVALNDGEDVVEIVGDAGSQLPDRFELLGVAQLGFEALDLGDVDAVKTRVLVKSTRTDSPDLAGRQRVGPDAVLALQFRRDHELLYAVLAQAVAEVGVPKFR